MRVVLDSSVFCTDFHLSGSGFRIFLEGAPRVGLHICVPALVIDEVVNKYGERVQTIYGQLKHASKEWGRIVGKEPAFLLPENAVEKERDSYKSGFLDNLVSVSASILPYPTTTHEVLVRRALDRRKPFRESGVGYRDSLIWESVLSLFKESKSVIYLVVGDKRDFWEGTSPHPDLLKDLDILNVDHKLLRVFGSLKDLSEELILPNLRRLEEMAESFLKEEVLGFSLRGWISTNMLEILNLHEDDWTGNLTGVYDHDLSFTSIKDIRSIEECDVRLLPSGNLILTATSRVALSITPNFSQKDGFLELTESATSIFRPIDALITFSLVLEKDTNKVLSSTIVNVERDDAWPQAKSIIESQQIKGLQNSKLFQNFVQEAIYQVKVDDVWISLVSAKSISDFIQTISRSSPRPDAESLLLRTFKGFPYARVALDEARKIFGLPPLPFA